MDDTPLNAGASTPPAPDAAPPAPPPAAPAGGPPDAKECIYCGEVIPIYADRCRHCAAFLPIAEGRAFGHHFFFFVCCMALFIGTLLPWEGAWWDSYGTRGVAAGFLLVFSGYGMVAAFFNIFHRRMIVWPVILAALEGTYLGWRRVIQLVSTDLAQKIDWSGEGLGAKKRALMEFFHLFGPGLWLVTVFSTIFWIVFVVSVIQGGRAASARKEAEKASRAARRAK